VADEVRNLALRAAEAAKNTSSLIEKTLKSVKKGGELTVATQEAFGKNVEITGKIGTLIDEIASASQEQAQGISQVSKAVAEMDKVTQKNAAAAEESASVVEELNAQAAKVKGFVGDLSRLVGGNGQGNISALLACPPEGSSGVAETGAFPQSALPYSRKKRGREATPAPLHASRVIPLEEGEFKEFK
jgi:methyl-accepting chemotaxis protein